MEEKISIEETQQENVLPKKITKQDLTNRATTPKNKVIGLAKTAFYLLLSSFLVSFAAYALIAPNNFTIGGAAGIAILLNYKTGIPQSSIVFCINGPLVVLSFFFVKKRFAIVTTLHIVLQTLWMLLLEQFPDLKIVFEDNGERIFAAIGAGICVGTAVAFVFKIGGSTGGADIIAVIIQKKIAAQKIAWVLFAVNFSIVASSLFVYNTDASLTYRLLPIMMSVFELYVESKVNSALTEGFQSAVEFRIITNKPDEMAQALMCELSRGVTSLPATGMYTKEARSMILCVVSRRQVAALKKIMKTIDPDSFAVMANVSQVLGLGFYTNEM